MNTIEHYVTKVLSKPYVEVYGDFHWWEVEVEYECYGHKGKDKLWFKTKSEADKVKVGYMYLALD